MSCSQSAGFAVMMGGLQWGLEEIAVGRPFVSAMVVLAALAPSAVYAQVNIDQGKAPAQIYDSDCAACHKSIRGLANGMGSSALTSFLAQHYTSSSKEAAALAAYVLNGGGGIGTAAPAHAPKTKPEPTTASTEGTTDAKRAAKPEAAKPQKPAADTTQKPEGTATGEAGSGAPERKPVPAPGRGEPNTGTAAGTGTRTRGQPKPSIAMEPPPAAPKPTAAVVMPSLPEPPSPGASSGTPESSGAQPSAEAPVPRDNIPD
jgi:hypothetical protein